MFEKFQTIEHAEKPESWIWEGTMVLKFGCHPEIVDVQIELEEIICRTGLRTIGQLYRKRRYVCRSKAIGKTDKGSEKDRWMK